MNTQNSDGADGQLEAPVGPLERNPLFVPGVMRCAKCSFQLHRTNLYMVNGTTGPGTSETEPCPNGCGPLWPVTWEQYAREACETAERFFDEAQTYRKAAALAYGHLWHVNTEPMAPIPTRGYEQAAVAARHALRDVLTHEQRGEAITEVRALLWPNARANLTDTAR